MFEEQRHCAKSEVEKTEVRHYPLSGRTITWKKQEQDV
jgi:hypothetical protein